MRFCGCPQGDLSYIMAQARIQSLDQFRGYTVAGMFFVNFAGE